MRSKRENECYSETTVNLRKHQCRFPSLTGFTPLEKITYFPASRIPLNKRFIEWDRQAWTYPYLRKKLPSERIVRKQVSLTGFTLIELLLIVLIISVILGLSLPFIKKNVNSASFKTFINKNYFFLDYAKTRSVLKGKILKVRINPEEKKIVLWEMKSKNEEGNKLLEIEIPENISVESEKENISFFPDGTIEEFEIIFSDDEARFSMIYSKSKENKIIREDDKSKILRDI